jgi:hypothetical protein
MPLHRGGFARAVFAGRSKDLPAFFASDYCGAADLKIDSQNMVDGCISTHNSRFLLIFDSQNVVDGTQRFWPMPGFLGSNRLNFFWSHHG